MGRWVSHHVWVWILLVFVQLGLYSKFPVILFVRFFPHLGFHSEDSLAPSRQKSIMQAGGVASINSRYRMTYTKSNAPIYFTNQLKANNHQYLQNGVV